MIFNFHRFEFLVLSGFFTFTKRDNLFVEGLVALAVAIAVVSPQPIQAEIYSCDGVYTNQPCKSATPIMKEQKSSPEEDRADQLRGAKRSRAQSFALRAYQLRREYGVSIDVAGVENLCGLETTSYEACDDRVRSAESDLNEMVESARTRLESERRAKKSEESNTESSQSTQQVIVIQNNEVLDPNRAVHHGGWNDGWDHDGRKPEGWDHHGGGHGDGRGNGSDRGHRGGPNDSGESDHPRPIAPPNVSPPPKPDKPNPPTDNPETDTPGKGPARGPASSSSFQRR